MNMNFMVIYFCCWSLSDGKTLASRLTLHRRTKSGRLGNRQEEYWFALQRFFGRSVAALVNELGHVFAQGAGLLHSERGDCEASVQDRGEGCGDAFVRDEAASCGSSGAKSINLLVDLGQSGLTPLRLTLRRAHDDHPARGVQARPRPPLTDHGRVLREN